MKLQGNELRDCIQQYADEITTNGVWMQTRFFIGKYIPEKKLKNAIASYAPLSEGEIPLILFDYNAFGNAKEGMLLTTSNLYYNVFLISDKAHKKGCIPLPDIQSAFFDMVEYKINDSLTAPTMVFFINTKPFAALFGVSNEYDHFVLDRLFSKLNTEQMDIKLLHPIWLFDGEELIHMMSSNDIECEANGVSGGLWKIFITNARIVRIHYGTAVRASSYYNPELFFNSTELSAVRDIVAPKYSSNLVVGLHDGSKAIFKEKKPGLIDELQLYIRKALERVTPVITFEDPNEKILFNVRADGMLCSETFWETIFGDKRLHAMFCVTNKRLLCYFVDQVSGLRRSDNTTLNWAITPPSFKWVYLPLSGIASITREKKGLFRYTRLHIRMCAPVGGCSRLSVVPDIKHQDGNGMVDPSYINAVGGTAVVDFSIFENMTKENRQKVIGILRSLLPGIETPEI